MVPENGRWTLSRLRRRARCTSPANVRGKSMRRMWRPNHRVLRVWGLWNRPGVLGSGSSRSQSVRGRISQKEARLGGAGPNRQRRGSQKLMFCFLNRKMKHQSDISSDAGVPPCVSSKVRAVVEKNNSAIIPGTVACVAVAICFGHARHLAGIQQVHKMFIQLFIFLTSLSSDTPLYIFIFDRRISIKTLYT